jgi:hypothetical protein
MNPLKATSRNTDRFEDPNPIYSVVVRDDRRNATGKPKVLKSGLTKKRADELALRVYHDSTNPRTITVEREGYGTVAKYYAYGSSAHTFESKLTAALNKIIK